jgi:predicted nucleic acid-binding protein
VTVFVDANVLVYARDASQGTKQQAAADWIDHLWRTRTGRLSTQVLSEFYVTVTRKLDPGMALSDARADVRDLFAWGPVPITDELVTEAWQVQDRFQFAYWDALIVAAAGEAGCDRLLTEDLQHGQDLDGLVVVDPFQTSPPNRTSRRGD